MPRRDPLILVTASGLAREVYETVRASGSYDVLGCIDDDVSAHGRTLLGGLSVLGGPEVLDRHRNARVLICAGKGSARASLAGRLALEEDRYATVIHPSVRVPASCAVSTGSILLANTVLTACVAVGRHVVAMPGVVLTHDALVEDYATLCAGVLLGGGARIGRAAYVGMSAAIRENVTVGAGSVVGMGSVVLDAVPAGETWLGVPARPRVAV